MTSIQNIMTADHKKCDDFFIKAEMNVTCNDWDSAQQIANQFIENIIFHFQHEENVLFPAFEEASGMRHGPTEMMRHEHEQIRALIKELKVALENKNQDRYLGLSETLLIYMQQHNMKEEQILYPMIESDCAGMADELMAAMQNKENCVA